MKGDSFERANRRRGRPASASNPDLSPLHDGNYDRLSECGAGGEGTGWWRVFFQFSFPFRVAPRIDPRPPPNPLSPTVGLLTQRAVRTLATYLAETNLNTYHWLVAFERAHPIPRDTGTWEDVSGQTFLRTMLTMPIGPAKFDTGREAMYDHAVPTGVDPRAMAQRVMAIRSQIAGEWVSDLGGVSEENALLLREAAAASLALTVDHPFDSAGSESEGGE